MALLSPKETAMFLALGHSTIAMEHLTSSELYRAAAMAAFLNKTEGKAADSLRRTFEAFDIAGEPKRFTKEFDELIEL